MKLFKYILAVILVSITPAIAAQRTITGTVVYENSDEPVIEAGVILPRTSENNTVFGVTTDIDGKFSIEVPDNVKQLEISYVGAQTEIVTIPEKTNDLGTIELKSETIAASQKTETITNTPCEDSLLETLNAEKGHKIINDKVVECIIDECKLGYELNEGTNKCEYIIGTNCLDTIKNSHAKTAVWDFTTDRTDVYCKINACESTRYELDSNANKCIDLDGEECSPANSANVKSAKYTWYENSSTLVCEVTCNKNYRPTDDKTACEQSEGDCTAQAQSMDANATAGEMKDGKCYITDCKPGWDPNSEGTKCTTIIGQDCTPPAGSRRHFKTAKWALENEQVYCKIEDCDSPRYQVENNVCVDKKGEQCTFEPDDDNLVVTATLWFINNKLECRIDKCVANYAPNDTHTQCVQTSGDCTPSDSNATKGELRKGTCVVTECKEGYVINAKSNKCDQRVDTSCISKISQNANAKTALWKLINGKYVCQVTECTDPNRFDINDDATACVDKKSGSCDVTSISQATKGKWAWNSVKNTFVCEVIDCNKNYVPSADRTTCVQSKGDCTPTDTNAKSGKFRDNTCVITECNDFYKLDSDNNKCISIESDSCKPDNNQHVKTAKWEKSGNTLVCKITECDSARYKLDTNNNICIDQDGLSCADDANKPQDANATEWEYNWKNNELICEIKKCADEYLPSDNGQKCEKNEGDCPANTLPTNATAGKLKRGVCYPTECNPGFEPDGKECVSIDGKNCDPMPENARRAHRTLDESTNKEICVIDECKDDYVLQDNQCLKPQLSKEDAEAQLKELQDNADAMKAKEQSLANRLLGGVSIGAMGIGGMQLASALSEQSADNAAEQDMAAYIATFKCDYGQGSNVKGGETNVTLPGANVLLPIYNEYATLAADLKTRKEALGMTPGIESEVILDAATSGLYDEESASFNGQYTSLYRALTDEDGEDAAAWAAQQTSTANKLKTGAIVAGAGAVVGVVGNVLINNVFDNTKNLSDEIIAKYDAKRTIIRDALKETEKESKQEALNAAPVTEEGKDSTATETTTSTNETQSQEESQQQTTVGSIVNTLSNVAGTVTQQNNEEPVAKLYNQSLFASGGYTLKNSVEEIDEVISELKASTTGDEDKITDIVLVAHTDADRILSWKPICTTDKICNNEQLSQARGNAVKAYIEKNWGTGVPAITVKAKGDTCADRDKEKANSNLKKLHRRVDIYVLYKDEDTASVGEACIPDTELQNN